MTFDATELIRQARREDAAAVDALLGHYRNYLRVLAQMWLPAHLPAKLDASDLVQETLMRAHERFVQFEGADERGLTAWLRRILARQVVDTVRRFRTASRSVSTELSMADVGTFSEDGLAKLFVHSGSTPSEQAARREMGVVLADALAELSELHRQAIVLRTLKELSWAEVATQMDRSITTVRMLWARGLVQLRIRLGEQT